MDAKGDRNNSPRTSRQLQNSTSNIPRVLTRLQSKLFTQDNSSVENTIVDSSPNKRKPKKTPRKSAAKSLSQEQSPNKDDKPAIDVDTEVTFGDIPLQIIDRELHENYKKVDVEGSGSIKSLDHTSEISSKYIKRSPRLNSSPIKLITSPECSTPGQSNHSTHSKQSSKLQVTGLHKEGHSEGKKSVNNTELDTDCKTQDLTESNITIESNDYPNKNKSSSPLRRSPRVVLSPSKIQKLTNQSPHMITDLVETSDLGKTIPVPDQMLNYENPRSFLPERELRCQLTHVEKNNKQSILIDGNDKEADDIIIVDNDSAFIQPKTVSGASVNKTVSRTPTILPENSIMTPEDEEHSQSDCTIIGSVSNCSVDTLLRNTKESTVLKWLERLGKSKSGSKSATCNKIVNTNNDTQVTHNVTEDCVLDLKKMDESSNQELEIEVVEEGEGTTKIVNKSCSFVELSDYNLVSQSAQSNKTKSKQNESIEMEVNNISDIGGNDCVNDETDDNASLDTVLRVEDKFCSDSDKYLEVEKNALLCDSDNSSSSSSLQVLKEYPLARKESSSPLKVIKEYPIACKDSSPSLQVTKEYPFATKAISSQLKEYHIACMDNSLPLELIKEYPIISKNDISSSPQIIKTYPVASKDNIDCTSHETRGLTLERIPLSQVASNPTSRDVIPQSSQEEEKIITSSESESHESSSSLDGDELFYDLLTEEMARCSGNESNAEMEEPKSGKIQINEEKSFETEPQTTHNAENKCPRSGESTSRLEPLIEVVQKNPCDVVLSVVDDMDKLVSRLKCAVNNSLAKNNRDNLSKSVNDIIIKHSPELSKHKSNLIASLQKYQDAESHSQKYNVDSTNSPGAKKKTKFHLKKNTIGNKHNKMKCKLVKSTAAVFQSEEVKRSCNSTLKSGKPQWMITQSKQDENAVSTNSSVSNQICNTKSSKTLKRKRRNAVLSAQTNSISGRKTKCDDDNQINRVLPHSSNINTFIMNGKSHRAKSRIKKKLKNKAAQVSTNINTDSRKLAMLSLANKNIDFNLTNYSEKVSSIDANIMHKKSKSEQVFCKNNNLVAKNAITDKKKEIVLGTKKLQNDDSRSCCMGSLCITEFDSDNQMAVEPKAPLELRQHLKSVQRENVFNEALLKSVPKFSSVSPPCATKSVIRVSGRVKRLASDALIELRKPKDMQCTKKLKTKTEQQPYCRIKRLSSEMLIELSKPKDVVATKKLKKNTEQLQDKTSSSMVKPKKRLNVENGYVALSGESTSTDFAVAHLDKFSARVSPSAEQFKQNAYYASHIKRKRMPSWRLKNHRETMEFLNKRN